MSANEYLDSRQYSRDEIQVPNSRVFLGGLNPSWDEQDVAKIMNRFGKIEDISVARNYSGESKGYAFVTFTSPGAAASSYGMHTYQGRQIESKPSIKQPARKKQEVGKPKYSQPSTSRPVVAKLNQTEDIETKTAYNQTPPVRVKVISLVEDAPPASQSASEYAESIPTSPQTKFRTEEKVSMSRLSKEFYPNASLKQFDYFQSFGLQAVYSTPVMHPYQTFSLIPFSALVTKSGEGLVGLEKKLPTKASKGESNVRINFYTFPGRD